jgi:2,4-didehydro-3-deoxy-L-rhamnonate hydrolase
MHGLLRRLSRRTGSALITTGTPPGVGLGMKPERYLKPGDEMRLGITGLGEQRQRVRKFSK